MVLVTLVVMGVVMIQGTVVMVIMIITSELQSAEHILQSETQSLHSVHPVLILCPYTATFMAIILRPVVSEL